MHPESFWPHFHKFYIYTGPESDNLLDDEDQSVAEKDTSNQQADQDSDAYSDVDLSDSDADECSNSPPSSTSFIGKDRLAPTIVNATEALQDLKKTLNPPRNTGRGYKNLLNNLMTYSPIRIKFIFIQLIAYIYNSQGADFLFLALFFY